MTARRAIAAAVATLALFVAYVRFRPAPQHAAVENDPGLVWRLGRVDFSSDEFAPGSSTGNLRYIISSARAAPSNSGGNRRRAPSRMLRSPR